MEQQDFDRYLKERHENQRAWHDKKAGWNKNAHLTFQTSIVILAVVTSVMTALDLSSWWFIPVVASALVSVLTALQKVFQFQELWISYRMTAEALQRERFLHMTKTGGYDGSDSPDGLFVDRVEAILSQQARGWETQQSKATESKEG